MDELPVSGDLYKLESSFIEEVPVKIHGILVFRKKVYRSGEGSETTIYNRSLKINGHQGICQTVATTFEDYKQEVIDKLLKGGVISDGQV